MVIGKEIGVGYSGIHAWIKNNFGVANKCQICKNKKAKKYEWASKSHSYTRNIEDWVMACVPCHKKMDGHVKEVVKLDESKNIISVYSDVKIAAKQNGFPNRTYIYVAIRKKEKLGGFYWEYKT